MSLPLAGFSATMLTWYPSHLPESGPRYPLKALAQTEALWRKWSARCTVTGEWRRDAVVDHAQGADLWAD